MQNKNKHDAYVNPHEMTLLNTGGVTCKAYGYALWATIVRPYF